MSLTMTQELRSDYYRKDVEHHYDPCATTVVEMLYSETFSKAKGSLGTWNYNVTSTWATVRPE